jgi:hypothetical protein
LATAIWSAENKTALPKARYPSGKGEVCKTFMRRFDPGPRLQFFQQLTRLPIHTHLGNCGDFCGDPLHFGLTFAFTESSRIAP